MPQLCAHGRLLELSLSDFSELGGGMDFSSMAATANAGDGQRDGSVGAAEGKDSITSVLEDDDDMPDLIPANQGSQDQSDDAVTTDDKSTGATESND